jgi:hypothetical protein
MMTPRERYERDAVFAALVDFMRRGVREMHYTPTEVREAAVLAVYLEECERSVPRTFALRQVEDWIETGRSVARR